VPKPIPLSNLTQRIITAVIGASVFISALVFHEASAYLIILTINLLCLIEFYNLCKQQGWQVQKGFGLLFTLLLYAPLVLGAVIGDTFNLLPLLLLFPAFIFIRALFNPSNIPFTDVAFTILGLLYLTLPLFLFCLIGTNPYNERYEYERLIGILVLLWSSDSGAYFIGKKFGRRKLFERISPKKTWEGFAGGLLLAIIIAHPLAYYFKCYSITNWLAIAVIMATIGTLGDLVESMFKRSIAIKDSGSLLPGHGGFLDRFDGLFIAAPFVFVYLMLMQ
jgi:phosphatidate cytidylyltransferase